LTQYPELSAESMGINYNKLDNNKVITVTEAGKMYLKQGRKLK
jgi:hypothetical protein